MKSAEKLAAKIETTFLGLKLKEISSTKNIAPAIGALKAAASPAATPHSCSSLI
jgi:hypothetical protein